MTTLNRQPAGTPVGGQFATGARDETGTELAATAPDTDPQTWMLECLHGDPDAGPFADEIEASEYIDAQGLDENEWKIVDRTIDPMHKGTCDGCDSAVGLFRDDVVHLDDNGQPILNDTSGHDPYFDPRTYNGGDVDTIADACHWGGTAWERWEDARAERDVEDAYERGLEEAKTSAVGGIDLTGSADDIRTRAQQAMWDAQTVYEIAGAKAAAQDILAEHPDAAYLELEESYDDDGSTGWDGGRILDANGGHIADFEDFSDDHWSSVTDLPTKPKNEVIVGADGSVGQRGDSRYAFMSWDGNRRQGYTGKIDLKAAAGIDLTTLIGGGK